MQADHHNATAWHHCSNRLCAHGRCTNRIDHAIDTTRIALLHKGNYILLACIDDITCTPTPCNLQTPGYHITNDDLLNVLGTCRGESKKPDRAGTKDQQTIFWLDSAESDGAYGTRQWFCQ